VIARLNVVDADLSRAVVRLTELLASGAPRRQAELAIFGNRAVIIVPRSSALKSRTGVELVPLSDGRALIAFSDALSVPQFELQLIDALSDPALEGGDRTVFEELAEILRSTRQSDGMNLRQRRIIVLHWMRAGAQKGQLSKNA
jgi:hypothetical protein